jgi:hypothetical protein
MAAFFFAHFFDCVAVFFSDEVTPNVFLRGRLRLISSIFSMFTGSHE